MSVATPSIIARKQPQAASPHIDSGRRVLELEAQALSQLAAFLNDTFTQAIETIAQAQGRVVVTGMGKSGHVGKKIAATFASTGTPAFFVHPGEASHGDLGMIQQGDVVLALSYSGGSKELSDIVTYTRRFGIPLISITGKATSTLAEKSDIVLLLPSCAEACPNGQAPTTSTTMTIALGDALAVALLEKKGFSATDFGVYHPGGKLGQQLVRVSEIMNKGDAVPVAHENVPMPQAIEIMTAKGLGCVILTGDDGKLTGFITDGDIRRKLSPDLLQKTAREVMTVNPKVIKPDALAAETVAMMNDVKGTFRKFTMIAVVDDENTPVGLLHIHDCLRAGFG